MNIDSGHRRRLASQGHRLKASVTVRANDLSEAAIQHVRNAFGDHELIKVRLSTRDRGECIQAANDLAERVPCELVQRIGRVALLYRPVENADDREKQAVRD